MRFRFFFCVFCVFVSFAFVCVFVFFCVLVQMGAEADAFHFHSYLIICHYFSLKIKIICCILISKGILNIFLYIKELFIICRLLYNVPIEMRFFSRFRFYASSFFLRLRFFLRFFFAFSFFLRFRFLRLRSLKYASSFSEICVFVL